jgi:hypothetical protein
MANPPMKRAMRGHFVEAESGRQAAVKPDEFSFLSKKLFPAACLMLTVSDSS